MGRRCRWWVGAVLGLVVIAGAAPAEAASFRAGTRVVVPADEVVAEDLYVTGAEVYVDGRVEGDLIVAGGVVAVRGSVAGDLIGVGADMAVPGSVGQTARLAAGQLRLSGPVGGDLLAAAGELLTMATTAVGGESVLAAGELAMRGTLGTRLTANAGELLLAGTVQGPTRLEAPRLRVGEEARLFGPLFVRTAVRDPIAPGATISGAVDTRLIEPRTFMQSFWPWLLRVAMALLLGLTLLWLMPDFANRAGKAAASQLWLRMLVGLGVMIAAPMAAIMAMLTVVGLPLGLLALGAYGACLYLAQLVAGWAAGKWVLSRHRGLDTYGKRAMAFSLGFVGISALKAIPVAGAYFTMAFVLWGLGALAAVFYRAYRERHPI